jgi:hypothetical protein
MQELHNVHFEAFSVSLGIVWEQAVLFPEYTVVMCIFLKHIVFHPTRIHPLPRPLGGAGVRKQWSAEYK